MRIKHYVNGDYVIDEQRIAGLLFLRKLWDEFLCY